VAALLALATANASAAPACATTTDPATPAAPAPGRPCWVDTTPYPFGADGLPVDTSKRSCATAPLPDGPDGYQSLCYLRVTSLAFRAWNRGLAATTTITPPGGSALPPTPFGVWLYNGSRWSPDPTFPGKATCPGNTILWAGKLDYWLVGGRTLCRYDGSTFGWSSLEIPLETRSKVVAPSLPASVAAGACFAWNNCTFFGPEGVRLHWNGAELTDSGTPDASEELRSQRGRVTAATARVAADGRRVGVAVKWTSGFEGPGGGVNLDQAIPAQPDGSPPFQLLGSDGGPFAGLPFQLPTLSRPNDPWRTDLVAVDVAEDGRGWTAGMPVGGTVVNTGERVASGNQPAPVLPFHLGAGPPCSAPTPNFEYERVADGLPNGRPSYAWTTIAVFPGSATALAGGSLRPAAAGTSPHDDGTVEPVLTRVACGGTVTNTRFREPDPTRADGAIAPANYGGTADAVTANAANAAWAAVSGGVSANNVGIKQPFPGGSVRYFYQRPHLYQWTDGARPDAPAGDDDEERPLEVVEDPPIFVEEPPPAEPEPLPAPPPAVVQEPAKTKRVRQKPAVYGARATKPRHVKGQRYVLVIKFRIRRPVTIGVKGLRKNKVVARSGLKRFKGKRGSLELNITRKRWPTRVRFYTRSGSTR
jgi:hypothetical protein